ncbi:hypothetical protein QR680_018710 [Steinernema hermaphroditum]|uniref:Tyrosine-protein phosphatase domain-containing protein n=1 Tax=Steinernema hermaphroditum TaxID=289476 RepID=A0AA39LR94_9BILA|nr:hypothetical protein QR680_018710 [Steinernema hermaphroditum]
MMLRSCGCFVVILLLFDGATSSNIGPVRLIPLQYWKGTPEPPTEADSCSQEVSSKSGHETLGIYFNLFKGERGYGTLSDEETLKRQAAECLRPEKLDNFKFNNAKAELQFTYPLSQDARCVMWFVLAMRRSGLRYMLDTETKTFNMSLRGFTGWKGCAASALPTSGDNWKKLRFCIVKKCDGENASPSVSEHHVTYDSKAITPNVNPINDFCDLECRYESYNIAETAKGAEIVVKPKKSHTFTIFATNPPVTTVDVKPAVLMLTVYWAAVALCVAAFVGLPLFYIIKTWSDFQKISSMMANLMQATFPEKSKNEGERESKVKAKSTKSVADENSAKNGAKKKSKKGDEPNRAEKQQSHEKSKAVEKDGAKKEDEPDRAEKKQSNEKSKANGDTTKNKTGSNDAAKTETANQNDGSNNAPALPQPTGTSSSNTGTLNGLLNVEAMKTQHDNDKRAVMLGVEKACAEFVERVTSQSIEDIKNEFIEKLKLRKADKCDYAAFNKNPSCNRYASIVCLDATRVKLVKRVKPANVPSETDYVHANWVKMEGVGQVFIAAQGPLDSTISDFWRMVDQEKVKTIVMLCQTEESTVKYGKEITEKKCAQYWPLEQKNETHGCMQVNTMQVTKKDNRNTYSLKVTQEGSNGTYTKLIQMTDWPDHGIPSSTEGVLHLLTLIDPKALCVVHCSAGIGRTGTFIAVAAAIERLQKGLRVNMVDIIKELRSQRASTVQTALQYCFALRCVLDYIKNKMPKHKDAILEFQRKYESKKSVLQRSVQSSKSKYPKGRR